jgi:hypothetical protein
MNSTKKKEPYTESRKFTKTEKGKTDEEQSQQHAHHFL